MAYFKQHLQAMMDAEEGGQGGAAGHADPGDHPMWAPGGKGRGRPRNFR